MSHRVSEVPASENSPSAPVEPELVPLNRSTVVPGPEARQKEAEPAVTEKVADTGPPETPPKGRNAIVILSHSERAQLVQVMSYLAVYGIETEIRATGSGYMLITVERFKGDPVNPTSDGYPLLKKIIELGAAYEPPPNFLSFTPESFAGAHGILIND
jgi:hypothetical protein